MNRYRFDAEKHIHLLDEKPLDGTSTSLKVVGGVPLYWSVQKALEHFGWAALNKDSEGNKITKKADIAKRKEECISFMKPYYEAVKGLNFDDFFNLVHKTAYHSHANFTKQKAEEGTDAHALMEEYIKAELSGNPLKEIHPSIQPMVDLSKKIVERWLFSELFVYSEKMWVGGIIDNAFIHKDGRICLGDFKNRDKVRVKDVWQVGGYSIQLKENKGGFDKDGNKVYEHPNQIDSFFVFPLKKPENYFERFDVDDIENDYRSINRLYKRDRELGGAV